MSTLNNYMITYIKLYNFIQFYNRGIDSVERTFTRDKLLVVFRGDSGKGKSTIMGECQPFPLINGSSNIVEGLSGEKVIHIEDMAQTQLYIIRHVYVPNGNSHTVKSFLTLIEQGVEKEIVNGSVTEFKAKIKEIFGLDESNIKMTGFGMRYGKNIFNFFNDTDSNRYYYIRNILDLDKAKEYHDIIYDKLRVNKGEMSRLQANLSTVVDYAKIRHDIDTSLLEMDENREYLERKIITLENEFNGLGTVDMDSRANLKRSVDELNRLLSVYNEVNSEDVREFYLNSLDSISSLNTEINMFEKEILNIKLDDIDDDIDINDLKLQLDNNEVMLREISSIDRSQLADIKDITIIENMLNYMRDRIRELRAPLEDYAKYRDGIYEELLQEYDELKHKIEDIQSKGVSAIEQEIYDIGHISCNEKCPLKDISDRVSSDISKHMTDKASFDSLIDKQIELKMNINNIQNIRNTQNIYTNMRSAFTKYEETFKRIFLENNFQNFISNLDSYGIRLQNVKYNASLILREKEVLTNIENVKKILRSIEKNAENRDRDRSRLNDLTVNLNIKKEELKMLRSYRILSEPRETIIKYRDKRSISDELSVISKEIDRINTHSYRYDKLKIELEDLNSKFSRLKSIIRAKNEELISIETKRKIYEDNSKMYKEVCELNNVLEKLRHTFGKVIPSIRVDSFLETLVNEANRVIDSSNLQFTEHLLDVEEKRISCDLNISVNGSKEKNVGLLSGGETGISYLAIIMAMFDIYYDRWSVMYLDEIDKAFHRELKEYFLGIVASRNSQTFMITHHDDYRFDEGVDIYYIV